MKQCHCRRGEHRSSAKHSQRNRRTSPPTVLMKCGGMTNLSVGFAASSPWEGEPRGVAVFHGLAPMGESWRAAPERGYSPHFADQRHVTHVSPEAMAAPTDAGLLLPSKTRDFHRIRLASLGTFPLRGRLEKAIFFLALCFFAAAGAFSSSHFLNLTLHTKHGTLYKDTFGCFDGWLSQRDGPKAGRLYFFVYENNRNK